MILLWDLHDVVFTKNDSKTNKWLRTLYSFKKKRAIIKKLSPEVTKLLCLYLLGKCKLTKKTVTSEELLVAAKQTDNEPLITLVHLFSHAYEPDKDVVACIQALKKSGHTHHIGSNIGQTLFESFQNRFPDVMNQFSHAHIVQYDGNTVIKKPNADFFTTYLTKHNLNPKEIIFIDDKLANIKAAEKLGFQTIHFMNAALLQEQLKKLGALSS